MPGLEAMESRELLTLLGRQLFPADNAWNQNVAGAPVAANSAVVISNIVGRYGDGRFHPDFGQDSRSDNPLYGIPFNVVHGNTQPRVPVVIDDYADESDLMGVPIPAGAVIEGDNQDGPVAGLENRGDSHLIVYDVDNNIAYELYQASRPIENGDGQWHAAQQSVWDMNSNTFRTLGWTSADAAGLAILPGLVRPDEALPINQGGQGRIDHAIRITLQNNVILNKYIYPASHIANPGQTNAAVQVPMGTRLRLKASVNIATLNPQSRVVALAMQQYGVIVADNGSNFFASGASHSVDANNDFTLTWDDDDIQDSAHGLKSLRFSDFEVVNLAPAVAGLSAQAGAAGSTITVNGSGFSGAAGHIEVRFGSTPATTVNVVSDSQLAVIVPPGTGTVDVRVQSGITSPSTQDINNPIFGYGISAVTTADRFTYGTGGAPEDPPSPPAPPQPPPPQTPPVNRAPTIARGAIGSPNPVNGTTTRLSVLGADDAGEANLLYTWQAIAGPSGPAPVFSASGSNAAKSTIVTFKRAGSYTFRVVVADSGGLTATSLVSVRVNAVHQKVVVVPATVTLANRARWRFTARALDQFGQVLAVQPAFTWTKLVGAGSITRSGLYTAPASGRTIAVVQAKAGGRWARAVITVPPRPTPAARLALASRRPEPH